MVKLKKRILILLSIKNRNKKDKDQMLRGGIEGAKHNSRWIERRKGKNDMVVSAKQEVSLAHKPTQHKKDVEVFQTLL